MRIHSKALWQYLHDTGALNGSEDDIAKAKAEYRRLYKKNWKQRRIKQKELRPSFTLKEYDSIVTVSKLGNIRPTTFAREVILATVAKTDFIPNRVILLKALQFVSISAIELSKRQADKHVLEPIEQAEKLLLQYLFANDSQNLNAAQS